MIAFTFPGGIPIYTYSLFLAAGTFLGLAWVISREPLEKAANRLESGLWTLSGALIGGRIAYVLLAWPYYHEHPGQAFQVYLGGLAWHGALAGAILVLAVHSHFSHEPFGAAADALTPLATVLAVAAWLGCIVDGCGYGRPVTLGGVPTPDEWGSIVPRFPVQIFGAIFSLAVFRLVDHVPEHLGSRSGLKACLLLFGLAVVQFAATLLSAELPVGSGLPLDAWISLAYAATALTGAAILFRTKSSEHRTSPSDQS